MLKWLLLVAFLLFLFVAQQVAWEIGSPAFKAYVVLFGATLAGAVVAKVAAR